MLRVYKYCKRCGAQFRTIGRRAYVCPYCGTIWERRIDAAYRMTKHMSRRYIMTHMCPGEVLGSGYPIGSSECWGENCKACWEKDIKERNM